MIREIKKEADRIVKLDEFDDATVLESICGMYLTLLYVLGLLLVGSVLLLTSPIWVVPYLIYKAKRKEQENEH